jgi:hypothetical protein
MPCIFCKSEQDLTEEHLFPGFCGGVLRVPEASCLVCNRDKCSTFESKVARWTGNTRHVFQVGNRYGKIPSSSFTCKIKDLTVAGMLRPDGQMELRNVINSEKLGDGRTRWHGFFTTPEDAEKWSENKRKRGAQVTDLPLPRDLTIEPVSQQTLQFAFSPEIKQMAAKVALVGLAYKYGVDYALSPQFDKLRERIFLANVPVHIFANEDFAAYQVRTPRQHSVITCLNAELNNGWSVVTLFGGLSYLVHVTDTFDEQSSRCFSIHYDVEQQKEYNPIVLTNEWGLIQRVLSTATNFESLEGVDQQWFKIVEADCRARGLSVTRTIHNPHGSGVGAEGINE